MCLMLWDFQIYLGVFIYPHMYASMCVCGHTHKQTHIFAPRSIPRRMTHVSIYAVRLASYLSIFLF